MKKDIFITLLFFTACTNATHKDEPQEVVIEQGNIKDAIPDTSYYLLTAGTAQQDTEAIKITISEDDKVAGKMMYMPYEKDWRFGKLSGTKKNDTLHLMWIFIQEGIVDSASIVFKIEDDKLIQQSYSSASGANENNMDTPSAEKQFQKVERTGFPKEDFDMGL